MARFAALGVLAAAAVAVVAQPYYWV
jgi:hypothetical protein